MSHFIDTTYFVILAPPKLCKTTIRTLNYICTTINKICFLPPPPLALIKGTPLSYKNSERFPQRIMLFI